jgi:myosin-1
MIAGKNEKVLFCDMMTKYDRRFKPQDREVFITETYFVIVGVEKMKDGPDKGKLMKVVKRKLSLDKISAVSMR